MRKHKVIAFIPVRGGSKSIPLKNIKDFCGKPLAYWSLSALSEVSEVDQIVIATDSYEIERIVLSMEFSKVKIYRRSAENSTDTSSTESVMLEYIDKESYDDDDLFILVQATSPFTQSLDIKNALKKYYDGSYDSLLSTVCSKRFYWNDDGTPLNYDYLKRPRRQDFKGMHMENGAFYISSIGNIIASGNRLSGNIGLYEMEEFTSFEIDEPDDWIICETLMRKHVINKNKSEIKLFLTDVDGVLTDAGMYYSEKGDEMKKFNTLDGKAFELLKKQGIKTGIITSESTKLVERRAKKIKADFLFQSAKNKLQIVNHLCSELHIDISNVAFIGDDINDTELLKNVGIAATPKNGVSENKNIPGIFVTERRGGEGAVREFVSKIIDLQENGM